ncbi:MAG: hypothetical protein JWO94_697 [Verrucomicrobiaceae bacterium]|nr:hypothetical protein [Verrucomicrobiaceae bacterium]
MFSQAFWNVSITATSPKTSATSRTASGTVETGRACKASPVCEAFGTSAVVPLEPAALATTSAAAKQSEQYKKLRQVMKKNKLPELISTKLTKNVQFEHSF